MSPTRTSLSGAIRLAADLSSLVNNSYSSDVHFVVGPDAATMYGHSIILKCRSKYFAAMFDDTNKWKEKANGVIHKPNASYAGFHALLNYLYTGNIVATNKRCLVDVIATAEEMNLDELSNGCQTQVMDVLNAVDMNVKDDNGDELQGKLS